MTGCYHVPWKPSSWWTLGLPSTILLAFQSAEIGAEAEEPCQWLVVDHNSILHIIAWLDRRPLAFFANSCVACVGYIRASFTSIPQETQSSTIPASMGMPPQLKYCTHTALCLWSSFGMVTLSMKARWLLWEVPLCPSKTRTSKRDGFSAEVNVLTCVYIVASGVCNAWLMSWGGAGDLQSHASDSTSERSVAAWWFKWYLWLTPITSSAQWCVM